MNLEEIAPGIAYGTTVFVNVYFVGDRDGWILVDCGIPKFAAVIRAAAQERFGDIAPRAIILTHGHFDHASNARELAEAWNCPIFAHDLELPYLTGRSDYPPADPTVGGAIAQMSRVLPSKSVDLGEHLQALQSDGENEGGAVPGINGWRWIATPGHSPGHVSLVRESDNAILAGDAIATMNMDSWLGMATKKQELWRAGSPFNCDWQATHDSVRKLTALAPSLLACGHGIPMSDANLMRDLQDFAARFEIPEHGRYVEGAAQADESGVTNLPPAPADRIAKMWLIGAAILAAIFLLRRKTK